MDDDPIRSVLDRIDTMLAELAVRARTLTEVRDLIRRALGEQTGGSSDRDLA